MTTRAEAAQADSIVEIIRLNDTHKSEILALELSCTKTITNNSMYAQLEKEENERRGETRIDTARRRARARLKDMKEELTGTINDLTKVNKAQKKEIRRLQAPSTHTSRNVLLTQTTKHPKSNPEPVR